MGFIRKSLAVTSVGVVRPNSKKQRVAKKQLRALKEQTKLLEEGNKENEKAPVEKKKGLTVGDLLAKRFLNNSKEKEED